MENDSNPKTFDKYEFVSARLNLRQRFIELTGRLDIPRSSLFPSGAPEAGAAESVDRIVAAAGLSEVVESEVRAILDALVRIENGTFGMCLSCGDPINLHYLRVAPHSTHCSVCEASHPSARTSPVMPRIRTTSRRRLRRDFDNSLHPNNSTCPHGDFDENARLSS